MSKKAKETKDKTPSPERRPQQPDRPSTKKDGGDHGLTQKEKEEARSH